MPTRTHTHACMPAPTHIFAPRHTYMQTHKQVHTFSLTHRVIITRILLRDTMKSQWLTGLSCHLDHTLTYFVQCNFGFEAELPCIACLCHVLKLLLTLHGVGSVAHFTLTAMCFEKFCVLISWCCRGLCQLPMKLICALLVTMSICTSASTHCTCIFKLYNC